MRSMVTAAGGAPAVSRRTTLPSARLRASSGAFAIPISTVGRAKGGNRLASDQLEDHRRINFAKADMARAARRDSPNEGPSVGMKHRQRPQVPIFWGHLKMRQRAENVEVGVAVRDHDAFGACSRAAGVIDGDQIVLIDLNRREGIRFRLYQASVIEPAVLESLQRDESFDSGQLFSDAIDRVEII